MQVFCEHNFLSAELPAQISRYTEQIDKAGMTNKIFGSVPTLLTAAPSPSDISRSKQKRQLVPTTAQSQNIIKNSPFSIFTKIMYWLTVTGNVPALCLLALMQGGLHQGLCKHCETASVHRPGGASLH